MEFVNAKCNVIDSTFLLSRSIRSALYNTPHWPKHFFLFSMPSSAFYEWGIYINGCIGILPKNIWHAGWESQSSNHQPSDQQMTCFTPRATATPVMRRRREGESILGSSAKERKAGVCELADMMEKRKLWCDRMCKEPVHSCPIRLPTCRISPAYCFLHSCYDQLISVCVSEERLAKKPEWHWSWVNAEPRVTWK